MMSDFSLIYLDSSIEDFVHSIQILKGFMNYNIAQLEMLNVMLTLKIWVTDRLINVFN